MAPRKLTKPELQIMEALWTKGALSVREIQETLPARKRAAYTTVQTVVYRLEARNAVRRVRKVGKAHIFEATLSRLTAQRRFVDDLLALFGGRIQPVVSHLIESDKLTLEHIKEAEETFRRLKGKRD